MKQYFVGFYQKPVARRVVGLTRNYYIMTQRIMCSSSASNDGCGKTFSMYDHRILSQLPKPLADSFPGFYLLFQFII